MSAYRTKDGTRTKRRAIYIPLPERLRKPGTVGDCVCLHCKKEREAGRKHSEWDTLIVPLEPDEPGGRTPEPWLIHYPELAIGLPAGCDWLEEIPNDASDGRR